jgi:oligopeptide transport system substrate-binding protein
MAFDRKGLISLFSLTYEGPANGGFVPPGIPGHTPGIGLPFDPQQARELLAQAGYPGGRDFPEIIIGLPKNENNDNLGKFLKDQWKQNLNVKSSIYWLSFHRPWTDQENRTSNIFSYTFVADYPDPATFLQASIPLFNTFWHDEQYEALIEKAHHCLDQKQRMEIYAQAQRILASEAVVVPLLYGRSTFLKKPWVYAVSGSLDEGFTWKDVIIEPHE